MKLINEVEALKAIDNRAQRQLSLQLMINQQFDVIEKLLESNAQHVTSPMSYNACAGFLDQARAMAQAAFIDSSGAASQVNEAYGTPLFGGVK